MIIPVIDYCLSAQINHALIDIHIANTALEAGQFLLLGQAPGGVLTQRAATPKNQRPIHVKIPVARLHLATALGRQFVLSLHAKAINQLTATHAVVSHVAGVHLTAIVIIQRQNELVVLVANANSSPLSVRHTHIGNGDFCGLTSAQ